jgi:hypothetical protein
VRQLRRGPAKPLPPRSSRKLASGGEAAVVVPPEIDDGVALARITRDQDANRARLLDPDGTCARATQAANHARVARVCMKATARAVKPLNRTKPAEKRKDDAAECVWFTW